MTQSLQRNTLIQKNIDGFWETIPPLWNHVRDHVRHVATEQFGITVEQFHILRHIKKGNASVSDLAVTKNISRSAVSQAVNLLVAKGLICRQEDPQDRRINQLTLTENGADLLSRIFAETRQWMAEEFTRLPVEKLAALTEAFDTLKTLFDETLM